jgi:cytochrome c-type biogenesis protein CcmH/NrfG
VLACLTWTLHRDLLPLIEKRDESSINVAKHATEVAFIRNDLTEVESETARVIRRNVKLTSTLFELAEQVKQKEASRLDDEETQDQIRRLEAVMKASRQRWRVIKGVASGVVAGSGVDWARDARLREVVLDLDGDE